nr:MAG TPA: transposase-like protein [Caudoviricetes sp.]
MRAAGCLSLDEMNVRSCKMRPSEGVKHSDGWIDIFENRLHLYPYQRIICTI